MNSSVCGLGEATVCKSVPGLDKIISVSLHLHFSSVQAYTDVIQVYFKMLCW